MSIKDLISEGNPAKVSLGRVSFLALWCVILYIATTTHQIDTSLITAAFGLLAYGFGKKLPKIDATLHKEVNKGE